MLLELIYKRKLKLKIVLFERKKDPKGWLLNRMNNTMIKILSGKLWTLNKSKRRQNKLTQVEKKII